MNSWVKNFLWLSFVIIVIVLMSFANSSRNEKVIGYPEIVVDLYEDQLFLDKSTILEKLESKALIGEDFTYAQVDFSAIETYLTSLSEIKDVKVYAEVGEQWQIHVVLRQPIARLFNLNGSSCYIDKDGRLMPLSDNYTAHVLTINGFVNETNMKKKVSDLINNDSLKTIEILDDLYMISKYVCSDKFFSSQITHIYVNSENEFEFIPRVGKQRILFGDSHHYVGKFKKLKVFYTEGLAKAGWGLYDTINVKFKNQIVCSKR
ncbi:MAG: cell division protein FtsQ/DivIB [Crocinitomicaceae bacterium]